MNDAARAPVNLTPLSGLPLRPTAEPLRVSLPRTPFPVVLSYDAPGRWSIVEDLGSQHIGHGYLRYTDGAFTVTSAARETIVDQSWQSAVGRHLRRG